MLDPGGVDDTAGARSNGLLIDDAVDQSTVDDQHLTIVQVERVGLVTLRERVVLALEVDGRTDERKDLLARLAKLNDQERPIGRVAQLLLATSNCRPAFVAEKAVKNRLPSLRSKMCEMLAAAGKGRFLRELTSGSEPRGT